MRFAPEWFPGAGFKRWARITRNQSEAIAEKPFLYSKRLMVNNSTSQKQISLKYLVDWGKGNIILCIRGYWALRTGSWPRIELSRRIHSEMGICWYLCWYVKWMHDPLNFIWSICVPRWFRYSRSFLVDFWLNLIYLSRPWHSRPLSCFLWPSFLTCRQKHKQNLTLS